MALCGLNRLTVVEREGDDGLGLLVAADVEDWFVAECLVGFGLPFGIGEYFLAQCEGLDRFGDGSLAGLVPRMDEGLAFEAVAATAIGGELVFDFVVDLFEGDFFGDVAELEERDLIDQKLFGIEAAVFDLRI